MNKVNILSNELDQAPKTKENWYQERLDAMKDVIYKAFDQLVVFDGDEIITNRIKKNEGELPLTLLNELKDGETLSIELKREQLDEKPGERNEAPGFPKFREDTVFSKLKNINTLLLEEMVFEKELNGKEFEDIIDTLDIKNPKDREE